MFRQWLCHPLADPKRINARLDAIDALLADESFRETFVFQLGKLPDLERLISRIHAGSCSPKDFVRVLEGFEQIRDAMAELTNHGEGGGLIGQLVRSLPDLDENLNPWETAFDREKAKRDGVLVPERGVEDEFDQSQDTVEGIVERLSGHLKQYQKDFKFVTQPKLHRCETNPILDQGKSVSETLARKSTRLRYLQKSRASQKTGRNYLVLKR